MKITNKDIISTKKGDKGISKNYSNESLSKTDILFDVLGNIDELTSLLGVTYHYVEEKEMIKEVQRHLQMIMSVIATSPTSKNYQKLSQITEKHITYLEFLEDDFIQETNITNAFVLPGSDSTKASSYLDLSRSVVRRVERVIHKFKDVNNRTDLDNILAYINRLSDLLFITARTYD